VAHQSHLTDDRITPPGRCHTQLVIVEEHHVGRAGHVDHAVYLRWVQNTVIAHWERFAPQQAVRDHLWVALTHEITYRRPAFLGDSVAVESIVERLFGARAFFTTRFSRGDTILSEVRSSWCCVDVAAYRPVRLASEITRCFIAKETS